MIITETNSNSKNNLPVSKLSIVLTAVWPAAALGILIYNYLTFKPYTDLFLILVLAANAIILMFAILYFFLLIKHSKKIHLKQNSNVFCWLCPQSVISWSFFQSASLLLIIFAKRFAVENQKAFWIGLAGLVIIYLVSQAGFCWIMRRFTR